MRKFIRNILLIFIPTVLFFVYLLIIFTSHGLHWFYTGHKFDKEFILGEPYDEEFAAHYKLQKNFAEYEILAIGSSRVMQISQDMFREKFFNLGYLSRTVYSDHNIIESLDLRNKFLLIGLDQWAFNSNWPDINEKAYLTGKILRPSALINSLRTKDILKGKVYPRFGDVCDIPLIGSGANMAMTGIKPDGSFYYGKIYQGMLTNNREMIGGDYGFVGTRDRIMFGKQRFEFGDKADMDALNATKELIKMCKERQNKIVIFLPPFPPSIVNEINNSKYAYMPDVAARLAKICDSLDVPFYDFTHFATSDADFVDGWHGGKKVYYEMLKQMKVPVLPLEFINPFESSSDSLYSRCRINFFK